MNTFKSLFQTKKVNGDAYSIELTVSKSEGFCNHIAASHQKQGEGQNKVGKPSHDIWAV